MKKLLPFILLFPLFLSAQKLPSIEEMTKDLKKYEGFFNFYWDENAGKIWLEVSRLDTEVLYVMSLPAGLGSNDIGLDRGLLGGERIVRFSKVGRKILLVQPNYDYRAVTNDAAEKRAVEQSFAQSTLWGFAAEAETGDHYLVDATDFLLRDAMQVVNRIKSNQQGNYSLDKSRSAIYLPRTKNFPFNTEIESTVTFTNSDGTTGNYVNAVTPSPEAITLRMHHSFVQLPDNDYQPRVFDPRSSFFGISYFDYSTPVSEPIAKYFISRHRLKKKDPNAAMSEPAKPIIYYLDNGTPEPIRSALLEGAGWWNQAFEAAGYKNAFHVKVLPEDADPMDIRYNMINWVHRSTRGWSYGASVTDPRTGEIIKGQVSLGSLRMRQDYLIAQGLLAPFENGMPADDKMLKMALARLRQLSAHEVGHTLGLMHNYIASTNGRASVMDYPHPLAKLNSAGEIDLGNAYDDKIGAWDKVAITWGYSDFLKGTNETTALNQILDDARQKGLEYLTDQDARPAGALHPRTHLWDNGTNVVDGLKEVMKVREKALSQFGEKNIRPGMPMAMLEDVLVPVYFYHRYQIEAVTKVVGGMNYIYTLRGDGRTATEAVSKTEQLKALNAVIDCIDPKVLLVPDRIAKLIPPRPAGYGFTKELFRKRTGLAFDVLSPAETAADLPFSFLFNSERLNRMAQYEAENGGLGVNEMINILLDKTWKAARRTGMEALIQLQTEQVMLTYLLAASVNDNNSFLVKSKSQKVLTDLKIFIEAKNKTATDVTYKGHLLLALERMKEPEKAKPTIHKEIPPGAPIGCDWEENPNP
ncbi:MAG TPA: zinc-dependent metalloprotease [Chitinophagaceae bacterium]|nr:zinc-dependent metalloprotease [Chitinophagaceae bacterium]